MNVSMKPSPRTLTDNLAERIRRDLLLHNLDENDPFMTETELARHYRASRNVVREAVSQLRALGILKSRQKKGLLMGRSNPVQLLSRSLPFYPQSIEDIHLISELRFTLEVGALPMAVLFSSDEQVDTLQRIAQRYQRRTDEGASTRELDGLDLTFHSLILEMSGNPFVTQLHDVIAQFFDRAPESFPDWDVRQTHTAPDHLAIAEAIKQRDMDKAHKRLTSHLAALIDRDARISQSPKE